jgi:hypothetical protein
MRATILASSAAARQRGRIAAPSPRRTLQNLQPSITCNRQFNLQSAIQPAIGNSTCNRQFNLQSAIQSAIGNLQSKSAIGNRQSTM